jgi:hypothetical protein
MIFPQPDAPRKSRGITEAIFIVANPLGFDRGYKHKKAARHFE